MSPPLSRADGHSHVDVVVVREAGPVVARGIHHGCFARARATAFARRTVMVTPLGFS